MYSVGSGDFKAVGLQFRSYFTEFGGLRPDDRVLDVGCGIGRMAVPLTSFLSSKGRYEGFEIVREGVAWCQKNISARFPNFVFRHADIRNNAYNAKGCS